MAHVIRFKLHGLNSKLMQSSKKKKKKKSSLKFPGISLSFFRMEHFFSLSKEEAPDNIPMMFITMPSSKDPEAKIRHPGTTPD